MSTALKTTSLFSQPGRIDRVNSLCRGSAECERKHLHPRIEKFDLELAIAALVQAFLFALLDDQWLPLRNWLLDHWCHRTGKRSRSTAAPLYRLRLALSQLWLAHRPFLLPRLDSG